MIVYKNVAAVIIVAAFVVGVFASIYYKFGWVGIISFIALILISIIIALAIVRVVDMIYDEEC